MQSLVLTKCEPMEGVGYSGSSGRSGTAEAICQGASSDGESLVMTVEHLERGEPTPTELGVANTGLDFGSLTKAEVRATRTAAAEAARDAARRAAQRVIEDRTEAKRRELRKRLEELGG